MLGIFKKRNQRHEKEKCYNNSEQQYNQENQQEEELTLQEVQEFVDGLKEKAESGDVQSMKWLGDIYYKGQGGIPQSDEMTFKYWKMAADYGDVDMAFKTGLFYSEAPRLDYEKTYFYVKKAADGGNENAMYVLYKLLASGLGCTQNIELAYQYLKMAAECGNGDAIEELSK
ncbi:MAG: tetratricopeptide repeat protein [Eubacteriales bacterium]|nr:tetratricopeptide repeat protein [Eubacteriales bacterium]